MFPSSRTRLHKGQIVCHTCVSLVVICTFVMTGCDRLFGPKIYTVATGSQGVPVSPLPPLKLDQSLIQPGKSYIWGRVVRDGKPVAKGKMTILAISEQALSDKDVLYKIYPGSPLSDFTGMSADKRPYVSSVKNDQGLYLIEVPVSGKYLLYCDYKTKIDKLSEVELAFTMPMTSPFSVDVMKDEAAMIDFVIEPLPGCRQSTPTQ